MTNRNKRDAERRQYIKQKTLSNIESVKNDPESLIFSIKDNEEGNN